MVSSQNQVLGVPASETGLWPGAAWPTTLGAPEDLLDDFLGGIVARAAKILLQNVFCMISSLLLDREQP